MNQVTINYETLMLIIFAIIGGIGWILASKEHSDKIKVKEKFESELAENKAKHEAELAEALEIRENDLADSERLVAERIKDIETVYKQALDDQNESLELYERYIRNFDAAITLSDKKVKEVDAKGSFSSDDELGFFFQNILFIQSALNKFKVDKEELDIKQADALAKNEKDKKVS